MPSKRSRTAPPTTYASKPASRSAAQTFAAGALSASRDRPCRSRGIRSSASEGSPKTRRMNLLIMDARILPAQRNHFPAAAPGERRELRVRIDRHRPADALEQRQVVVRVAVAARLREVAVALPAA